MATTEQPIVNPEHLREIRATLGVLSETQGGTIDTRRVLVYVVRDNGEAVQRGALIDTKTGHGSADPAVLAILRDHAERENPVVVVACWELDADNNPVAVTYTDRARKIHGASVPPNAGFWLAKAGRWRWFPSR